MDEPETPETPEPTEAGDDNHTAHIEVVPAVAGWFATLCRTGGYEPRSVASGALLHFIFQDANTRERMLKAWLGQPDQGADADTSELSAPVSPERLPVMVSISPGTRVHAFTGGTSNEGWLLACRYDDVFVFLADLPEFAGNELPADVNVPA